MAQTYGVAESALLRADAYRTGFKTMTMVAVITSLTAVAGIGTAVYLSTHVPEPRYFATTADGRIQPLVPLNEPHLSADSVNRFAVQAVTNALTYDFANYRSDFQDAQKWFTKPAGWNSFVDAVNKSGTLDLVKDRRFSTTAIAQSAVIVREGVSDGVYEWVVQMPLRITYQSASERTSQSLNVTVRLQRLQTYQSPYAVAIAQFITAPGGG